MQTDHVAQVTRIRRGGGGVMKADERQRQILLRARADGREMDEHDVRAVLDAEAEYLAAVGALRTPRK